MTKFMDTLKKLTPTGFSYPIENNRKGKRCIAFYIYAQT